MATSSGKPGRVTVPRGELDEIVQVLEHLVERLTRIIERGPDAGRWMDTGSGPGYSGGDVHDPRD